MRPIIYEAVVIVEPIACITLLRILGINDYRSAHHMNSAYCLNLLDVNSLGIHLTESNLEHIWFVRRNILSHEKGKILILLNGSLTIILFLYLYYSSSKNIACDSNRRSNHWRSQQINLDMFRRRKPITKIPMASEIANSAGKTLCQFFSDIFLL